VPIARGVSQISPPIRVLLVVAVAFLGAYMMFLRPKEEVVPPAETTPAPNTQTAEPAVSGPGKAAEAAQEAVTAANGATAAETGSAAEPATGQGAATPGSAEPAKDLKGVPVRVRKAIRQGDVVVLLFWNRKGADDRDVRRSLRRVDTWNGRVVTQAAPLSKISRYGRIARGVDVNQSPTVVVVDPELHAETIVGYTDTATIEQMVVDALRNTTGLFTSTYLRKVNEVCARYEHAFFNSDIPEQPAEFGPWAGRVTGSAERLSRGLAGVPAPKRFAAFKRSTTRDIAALATLYASWTAYVGTRPSAARVAASVDRFAGRERRLLRSFSRRMDERNVLACGTNS
jgi:hypothetical protein